MGPERTSVGVERLIPIFERTVGRNLLWMDAHSFSVKHVAPRIFEFLEDHCREAGTSALAVQGGTEEMGSEFGGFGKLEVEFSVVGSIRG